MKIIWTIAQITLVVSCINCANNHHIAKRFDWRDGDDGRVLWSEHCDFFGSDLREVQVPGEQCGGRCLSDSQCTHFTWTSFNGGTCYLKQGGTSLDRATYYADNSVCGTVKRSTNTGGAGNVKGTRWADTTDPGGCQMPTGDYSVRHALALGQEAALGNLKWRNGLCGQVLRVDCGGGAVEAVVASTCNLGSDTCGVDLISRTWNTATGNKPPGISTCSVQLTSTNPLRDSSPVCYFRPNSGSQAYYASLGVLNTGGRIVKSATAGGVDGRFQSGSGWIDFDGQGQPKFNGDADVVFRFEDGSSNQFKLRDCKDGGNTMIFS